MTEPRTERRQSDPSENVLRLVEKAVERSDKLRDQGQEYIEKRIVELFDNLNLRLTSEIRRIDERRENDQENVRTANEAAIKRAETLALVVDRSAEAMREGVTKTADSIATNFRQVTEQVTTRITALEKCNYENQGRSMSTPDVTKFFNDYIENRGVAKGHSEMSAPLLVGLSVAGGAAVMRIMEFFWK